MNEQLLKMNGLSACTTSGNAIKLGVQGFVRICIETCARAYFGACETPGVRHQCGQPNVNLRQVPAQGND